MRVVLDTNVLLSGLRDPDRVCGLIVDEVTSGELEPVYSSAIMDEYTEVLQRPKFALDPVDVDALLHRVEQEGYLVEPALHPPLKDRSDTKFLEAALASHAEYLVTGNLKDFPRSPYHGLKIVGPGAFMATWIKGL